MSFSWEDHHDVSFTSTKRKKYCVRFTKCFMCVTSSIISGSGGYLLVVVQQRKRMILLEKICVFNLLIIGRLHAAAEGDVTWMFLFSRWYDTMILQDFAIPYHPHQQRADQSILINCQGSKALYRVIGYTVVFSLSVSPALAWCTLQ